MAGFAEAVDRRQPRPDMTCVQTLGRLLTKRVGLLAHENAQMLLHIAGKRLQIAYLADLVPFTNWHRSGALHCL